MSPGIKALILAAVIITEIPVALVLWRKFTGEGKPHMAAIMAVQAVATVAIFAVILFVLLD